MFLCVLIFLQAFLQFLLHENCLAHEGQGVTTPLDLKFKDFKISFPILISLTGSSDRDTLKVSPMPSSNKTPNPIEDFALPGIKLDSVIPNEVGNLFLIAVYMLLLTKKRLKTLR